MKIRRNGAGTEHGFQDEVPEGGWSPERQRLSEQVAMLVKTLRTKDEGVQDLAMVQITLFGTRVVPYLTAALEDALDESDLKQTSHESNSIAERQIAGICAALGIIRDGDAVVDLAAALPRREAVEALAKIGGERALDLVMGTIENKPTRGGSLMSYSGKTWWPSIGADADPAFVRRIFLLFGDAGKRRLKEELANESGSRRAAVAEIIRIMGY